MINETYPPIVPPVTRARVLALVQAHPGATEDELVAADGGGVSARLRIGDGLRWLHQAAHLHRDDDARWWVS